MAPMVGTMLLTVTRSCAISASASSGAKFISTLRMPYMTEVASHKKPMRPYMGMTVSTTSWLLMSSAMHTLPMLALL